MRVAIFAFIFVLISFLCKYKAALLLVSSERKRTDMIKTPLKSANTRFCKVPPSMGNKGRPQICIFRLALNTGLACFGLFRTPALHLSACFERRPCTFRLAAATVQILRFAFCNCQAHIKNSCCMPPPNKAALR